MRGVFRSTDVGLALDPGLCRELEAAARAGGGELRPQLAPSAEGDEGARSGGGGAARCDGALGQTEQQQAQQRQPQQQVQEGQPARAAPSIEETGEDMLPLAQRFGSCVELMHAQWRRAIEVAARSRAAAARAADELRAEAHARACAEERGQELGAAVERLSGQLTVLQVGGSAWFIRVDAALP